MNDCGGMKVTKFLLRIFVPETAGSASGKARTAIGKLSGTVGMVCNLLLFAAKLMVGLLAGSVSVMADALNNLSDAISSVVTLIGFKLAEKPADADHPYGHARYEYLSGLAVAAMIIVIGVELGRSSIEKIFAPSAVIMSDAMFIVLVVSVLLKLWLSHFNRSLGKQIESSALMATSADSRNDAISTGAVLLAALDYVDHSAPQPPDMDRNFYDSAHIGTSSGNIARFNFNCLSEH